MIWIAKRHFPSLHQNTNNTDEKQRKTLMMMAFSFLYMLDNHSYKTLKSMQSVVNSSLI